MKCARIARVALATLLTVTGSMLCAPALAQEVPVTKLCHENEDSYPWLFKDRVGLTTALVKMAEKQLGGGKLEILPLPWKRCLEEVKAGDINGIIKISYTPERAAELCVFPMAGEKADATKRLLNDTYSIYRLKGSAVTWDGKVLVADGRVGAQSGFSVVKQLQSLGAKVDDGTRSADDNLKKLIEGRVVAVALQSEEGDISVAASPDALKIEKITPVLVEKPYFVTFSKQFYAKEPGYAKKVWDAIATARESAEYKDLVKKFK